MILRFRLILNPRSSIAICGDLYVKPSNLQFNKGSSAFTVLEVVSKQSYLDLKKFPIFRECSFVINLFFLFIEKKSFEIAIFPSK